MAREDQDGRRPPQALEAPQVSLIGRVDEAMFGKFQDQLREAEKGGNDIAIEITTQGGDAEIARRMVLDVEIARSRLNQRIVFLGKTEVYSAGVTFMAAFPREDRYLAKDAMLLIHCRQLEKTVELSGPIRASLPKIEALKQQLEVGVDLEVQNFERLIEGSDIAMDELTEKALYNWYLSADQALERGLIAGVIDLAAGQRAQDAASVPLERP